MSKLQTAACQDRQITGITPCCAKTRRSRLFFRQLNRREKQNITSPLIDPALLQEKT